MSRDTDADSLNQYKFTSFTSNEENPRRLRIEFPTKGQLWKLMVICAILPLSEASVITSLQEENLTRHNQSGTVRGIELIGLEKGPVEGKWYTIMSRGSGKVLDMFRAERACIWGFAYEDNQMFRFESIPDMIDTYVIAVYGSRNEVLEVSERSSEDGGEIQRARRDDHPHQKWKLTPGLDGGFHLDSAGSGLCLDVKYGLEADGTDVTQWECNREIHQTWDIVPLC